MVSYAGVVRVLIDGAGSAALADALVPGLRAAGRDVVRVSARDFLRPAGERFEWGREDAQSFRERWLDESALRREVLDVALHGTVLPSLWDADRDRSTRAAPVPLSPRGVVVIDGVLLLGRALPAELTVHLAMSAAGPRRRPAPTRGVDALASIFHVGSRDTVPESTEVPAL